MGLSDCIHCVFPDRDMRQNTVLCAALDGTGLYRMAYTEWGDPTNPKVLLCVHGLTRNGRDFDYLAQQLAKDYRVVCPDVVGRGGSDWLQTPEGSASPRTPPRGAWRCWRATWFRTAQTRSRSRTPGTSSARSCRSSAKARLPRS